MTEYGMGGQVSIFGDIYNFGILWSKHSPVRDHGDACHAMNMVDPSLLIEWEDAHGDRISVHARRLEECSVSMMQIGLSCSAISPSERMLMDVVNKLQKIIESYLNLRGRG
ncbi:hypothetical protein DVH24_006947 [Malus domestica]|uniref:Serine-threonine/tyrosine-protein kinase catalytic domain-containing protein n=1 Tax=Malus domestica TaxID=3750 RepID=A0A498IA60_MALDO|nr:hypothetical protein DVH24_006947 [Malus domestica]